MGHQSGFIGIVGPTNSGKSTLMNALIGNKVSIVSPKVQTTYHAIRGVITEKTQQLIFTDTPGYQKHHESIAQLLNSVADKNAKECDVLLWVFDASNPRMLTQIEKLTPKVVSYSKPSFCVLNKVDKVNKLSLLPLIQKISALGIFKEIIPISAIKKDGVEKMKQVVAPLLPEGPVLYPDGQITDRPHTFIVSEMLREKIYKMTHEEVPYCVRVEIENWLEEELPKIFAVIYVDSESKKGILIGKNGDLLKRIGSEARVDIEKYLGKQVFLKLHVVTEKNWQKNREQLRAYLELQNYV